jgi:glycosyltransferase involved in cell wall biosynthesis
VTDVGGMAEVVRLARAGYMASAMNPEELTAAILRMAGSHTEREQFSTNAESAYRTHFTLETMVGAYMELYRNTARVRHAAKC